MAVFPNVPICGIETDCQTGRCVLQVRCSPASDLFYLRNSFCSPLCYQLLPSGKDPLSNLVPPCSPLWFVKTSPAVLSHPSHPNSCFLCVLSWWVSPQFCSGISSWLSGACWCIGGRNTVLKHTGNMIGSVGLVAPGWQSTWKALGFIMESCPLSVGRRIREENGGKGMGK